LHLAKRTAFSERRESGRSIGTRVLFVVQNAMAVLSTANYGYVLETGKIVLEGDGAALLDDPEVRRVYLGE